MLNLMKGRIEVGHKSIYRAPRRESNIWPTLGRDGRTSAKWPIVISDPLNPFCFTDMIQSLQFTFTLYVQ